MNDSSGDTARDISMKGAGYYSKATTGAKDVIDRGTPMILDAIAAMDFPDDGSRITMADMGCADGGTSIGMVRAALEAIRARWPSRPIQMVYTDLPRNDFSQVFRIVHGQTEIETYVDDIDNLYVFASATSFHKNMFPPALCIWVFRPPRRITSRKNRVSSAITCTWWAPRAMNARPTRSRAAGLGILPLQPVRGTRAGRASRPLQLRHRRGRALSRPHRRCQHVRHVQ